MIWSATRARRIASCADLHRGDEHGGPRRTSALASMRRRLQQVVDDVVADLLEPGLVVQGLAIPRPRNVHDLRGTEGGGRPGAEGDDAIGEQDAFVDVIGDEKDRLLVLLPDPLDLVL